MAIHILWPWELPKRVSGTVVVIDVYAATTNIASFLGRGVAKLLVVNRRSVVSVKREHKEALLIGDSHIFSDLPLVFDAHNDPSDNVKIDVSSRTVLLLTGNGTRVIELAFQNGATAVLAASFLNITAVASWLRTFSSDAITLLPAGESDFKDSQAKEDLICAESVRDVLLGKTVDWEKRFAAVGKFMYAHYNPAHCALDLPIILDLNRYPVVPLCRLIGNGLIEVIDGLNTRGT